MRLIRYLWLLFVPVMAQSCAQDLESLSPFPCAHDLTCPSGYVCDDNVQCVAAPQCQPSETLCGVTCTNLSNNAQSCGECGKTCGKGAQCCGGICTNTTSNPQACGACGVVCSGSASTCSRGQCVCPDSGVVCGTGVGQSCVDLASDTNNCGSCGNVCNSGFSCIDGVCECGSSRSECGSGSSATCADLKRDANNCGACGVSCGATNADTSCASGSCKRSCREGYGDCNKDLVKSGGNGCETNTLSDTSNCGACAHKCRSGEQCSLGECCSVPLGKACAIQNECGCSAGSTCNYKLSQSCNATSVGTLTVGATCSNNAQCKSGTACVRTTTQTQGTCRQLCGQNSDCTLKGDSCWPAPCGGFGGDGTMAAVSACASSQVLGLASTDASCCTVTSQLGCQSAGSGQDGATCETYGDCAPGFSCASGLCRAKCASVDDCATPKAGVVWCGQLYTALNQPLEGLSVCSVTCDPVHPEGTADASDGQGGAGGSADGGAGGAASASQAGDGGSAGQAGTSTVAPCGADQACYLSTRTVGQTSCGRAGVGVRGSACMTQSDCVAGYTCFSRVCTKFCSTTADCGVVGQICAGLQTLSTGQMVGHCAVGP